MVKKEDPTIALASKPVGRLLLQYSLPAIIAASITSINSVVGGVFIGHGIGPLGLSGLAVAFPLFTLLGAVSMLLAVGGATQCSIEMGKGRLEVAHQVLGQVVLLALVSSVICSIGFLLFLDPVLQLFGAGAKTLPYARDYMEVTLYGNPVLALMIALSSLMRASGYPQKAMLTSMLSVVLSIVLTPLFIFYFKWGMSGAAFAAVLAHLIAVLWMVLHFVRKDVLVRFKRGIYALRRSVVMPVVTVGMAPFLMNLCATLVVVIINKQLNTYGGELAVGAYGILNRLLLMQCLVVMGLTQGMQPIVGFNYGAKRIDRVSRTLWYGVAAGMAVTSVGAALLVAFPTALARFFTDNEDLIAITAVGLRFSSFMFFLVGGQIVISSFFQFIGRPGIAIFLSLTRQLIFFIPGLIFMPLWLGLDGVWLSMPLADTIAFLLTAGVLWRKLRQYRKWKARGVTPEWAVAPKNE